MPQARMLSSAGNRRVGASVARWLGLVLVVFRLWQVRSQTLMVESGIIKTGAVLSTVGNTATMQQARMGYEYFVNIANSLNHGRGMRIKGRDDAELYFRFNFTWLDDNSVGLVHEQRVRQLLDIENVHFLFGSHPRFALKEAEIANDRGRINFHCCVGLDAVYSQGLKYVFGIQVSNRKYSELTIRTMNLKGLERLAIVHYEPDEFTMTTCDAAKQVAIELKQTIDSDPLKIVLEDKYINMTKAMQEKWFFQFAKKAQERRVDAVVACSLSNDGQELVRAFNQLRYPLKSMFLTIGPSMGRWVDDMGDLANDLMSAAQWHKGLKYSDPFFGDTLNYTYGYKNLYGEEPTYVSAGASGVGYTTMLAISEAFSPCYVGKIGADVDKLFFGIGLECDDGLELKGYERILGALRNLSTETMFGEVKFNEFQRNDAFHPATTQVRAVENGKREITTVLPVVVASAELKMPADNPYREPCPQGTIKPLDQFAPCQQCPPGETSDRINATECAKCQTGTYLNGNCTKCPENSLTIQSGAASIEDCICNKGFYSPQGVTGVECRKCPSGARCQGGTFLPEPKKGYWSDDQRVEMYACDPPGVCLGGPDAKCEDGYSGRLCAHCSKGYFGLSGRCLECTHPAGQVIAIICLIVAWYILNVVISSNIPSFEILLSWAQLANVIGEVNLHWPDSLNKVFAAANILDFDVDILEPSCVISNWSYRWNFVVQLLLPLLMGSLAFMGYGLSSLMFSISLRLSENSQKKLQYFSMLVDIPEKKEQLDEKWDATRARALSSFEVTYVTVTKYCFDAMKCERIGSVNVLSASPDVLCGSQDHKVLIAMGTVGIIFYTLGYLGFVSWKLWDMYVRRSFAEPTNLRRYGFIYTRFELEYFWTGLIILVRRLCFVAVLVFMNNPAFQAGAMAVVTVASLMLHTYTAPYADTYLDVLFSFLLVALMFEAFGGVMFISEDLPEVNRKILEWIVLTALFILAVAFFLIFCMELVWMYEIRVVKKMHCHAILGRAGRSHSLLSTSSLSSLSSASSRKSNKREVSSELLQTFHPHFVYTALTRAPEKLLEWDRLSDMLKDFMADQSETSYLSMERVAKFWRKLVERFPELVEFLAVTDEDTRGHFNSVATTLFQDFYLKKKVEPLPLHKILNWRDRAPLAQWLAMARDEDRNFFTRFMTDLIRTAKGDNAAESLEIKIKYSGKDNGFQERMSSNRKLTKRQRMILKEIEDGKDPLSHACLKSFGGAATAVRAAFALRDNASRRGRGAGLLRLQDGLPDMLGKELKRQVNDSPIGDNHNRSGNENGRQHEEEVSHVLVGVDHLAEKDDQTMGSLNS